MNSNVYDLGGQSSATLKQLNLTIIYAKNPLEFGSNEDGIIFFFHKAVTSRAALSSKMLTTTVIEIYINQKKIWNI